MHFVFLSLSPTNASGKDERKEKIIIVIMKKKESLNKRNTSNDVYRIVPQVGGIRKISDVMGLVVEEHPSGEDEETAWLKRPLLNDQAVSLEKLPPSKARRLALWFSIWLSLSNVL
jgi:hypothetical protein